MGVGYWGIPRGAVACQITDWPEIATDAYASGWARWSISDTESRFGQACSAHWPGEGWGFVGPGWLRDVDGVPELISQTDESLRMTYSGAVKYSDPVIAQLMMSSHPDLEGILVVREQECVHHGPQEMIDACDACHGTGKVETREEVRR